MLKTNVSETLFNKFKKAPEYDYIFHSMALGNTPCEIYVDDQINPKIMIVWDTKITFYFLQNNATTEAIHEGITFLKTDLLNVKSKGGLNFAKLYSPDLALNGLLLSEFSDCSPETYGRILYKHSGNKVEMINSNLKNDGIKVHEITSSILSNKKLDNRALLLDEIEGMWGTKEAFLNKGFGYCCLNEEKIVGWCTAEYISPFSCGCGVETIKDYQRKGYATLMADEVSTKAKTLGLDLYWDSWDWNEGSVKTAEKTGFLKAKTYDVIFLKFNE